MGKYSFIVVLIACTMLCGACRLLRTTFGKPADVRAERVEGYINKKNFTAAAKEARRQARECYNDSCRALANFTWGYIYQVWADADASNRDSLAAIAEKSYRKVLAQYPDDMDVRKNLAKLLVANNKPVEAIEIIFERPQNEYNANHHIFLTDLLVSKQNYSEAFWAFFGRTRGYAIPSRTLHERVTGIYDYWIPDDGTFFHHCTAMQTHGWTDLVRYALLKYITCAKNDNRERNTNAFLWWIYLMSEGSSAVLDSTFSGVKPSFELKQYLDAETDDFTSTFWSSDLKQEIDGGVTLLPKIVLTEAIRAKAQYYADHDSLKAAETLYNRAFDVWRPRTVSLCITLENTPEVLLRVAGELAKLYANQPASLYRMQILQALESRLYGKTTSDATMHGEAIANFHAVLGLLYADNQKDFPYGSSQDAALHLNRAIENFPPSYHTGTLKLVLAHQYRSIPTEAINARKTLLSAATDFLNNDDMVSAGEILNDYTSELQGDSTFMREIVRVIDIRKNFAHGLTDTTAFMALIQDEGWRAGGHLAYFHSQQEYKMYTELAAALEEKGKQVEALRYHAFALQKISHVDQLSNYSGMLSLQHQCDRMAIWVRLSENARLPAFDHPEKSALRHFTYYIPGTSTRKSVAVHPDFFAVAAVLPKLIDADPLHFPQVAIKVSARSIVVTGASKKLTEKEIEEAFEKGNVTGYRLKYE